MSRRVQHELNYGSSQMSSLSAASLLMLPYSAFQPLMRVGTAESSEAEMKPQPSSLQLAPEFPASEQSQGEPAEVQPPLVQSKVRGVVMDSLKDIESSRTNLRNSQFPELDELSEQIGEFIHYWGFKRVHGRIWTHLFLAKRPMDAGELVTQMQISKALVSISLRELLDFDVIQEIGKSPRGTNLYRTNPDILAVIMSVLRQREKRMLSRISAAHESLSRSEAKYREEAGISDQHLDQLKELTGRASGALDSFIALSSLDFGPWGDAFKTSTDSPACALPETAETE